MKSNKIDWTKCINCGSTKQLEGMWFCYACVEVKESAYAESRKLGEKTHSEVIKRRDAALKAFREEKRSKDADSQV